MAKMEVDSQGYHAFLIYFAQKMFSHDAAHFMMYDVHHVHALVFLITHALQHTP